MENLKHDQTERHIINVPIPVTRKMLVQFIMIMNSFDEETAEEYADHIIDEGRVDLNPSSSLGEGANIVDCFTIGWMVYLKKYHNENADIKDLWFHPCRTDIPIKVTAIDWESQPADIDSNEHVMYSALDQDGNEVRAEDLKPECPGNSDNLAAYKKKEGGDDLGF
jgi:hypothetical protein